MADPITELKRIKAGPMLGGQAAKLVPKPEPSGARQWLETLTGYPADPERGITPVDALQMLTVGGGAIKGGMALAKKAPQVGKYLWGKNAQPSHAISRDPYGFNQGPTSRRQFLDKLVNNDNRRARKAIPRLGNEIEDLSDISVTMPDIEDASEVIDKIFDRRHLIDKLYNKLDPKDTMIDIIDMTKGKASPATRFLKGFVDRFGPTPKSVEDVTTPAINNMPTYVTQAIEALKARFKK